MSGCCKRTPNIYGRKARGREIREKYTNQIIDLYKSGLSSDAIGRKFGANGGVVCAILRENGVEIKSISKWKRKYSLDENAFASINSEESAYWLGFMYADGCNMPQKSMVSMSQNVDDIEVLDGLKKFLKTDYPIRNYPMDRGFNKKELFILSVRSEKLSRDLVKHGCIRAKTHKLTFPSFIEKSLVKHFVRGYLDGDGSIKKHPSYAVNLVGTQTFLDGLVDFLKQELPFVEHKFYKRHPDRENNITQLYFMKKHSILDFLEWIYSDSTIRLKRKHDKYLELLEHRKTSRKKW